MNRRWRRLAIILMVVTAVLAFAYAGLPHLLYTGEDEQPRNTVIIDNRITTSGQPSVAQLRRIAAQGYRAVINLAPPGSTGSVTNEPEIVRDLGMAFHGIPVDWSRPTPSDFSRFRELLDQLHGHRVWVHCQLNMRVSVFVFLRRVIDERVSPDQAIREVHAVWVPNEVWAGFMRDQLGRAGVSYDSSDLF